MEANMMRIINALTFVLVIIGAINWGLYAFNHNLVSVLLGTWPHIEKAIYILVAISGIYQLMERFA